VRIPTGLLLYHFFLEGFYSFFVHIGTEGATMAARWTDLFRFEMPFAAAAVLTDSNIKVQRFGDIIFCQTLY